MVEIGSVISDDETPNFYMFRFRPEPEVTLAPGEFVCVQIADKKHIIGRVTGSVETNPHETVDNVTARKTLKIKADYPTEGESVIIYRVYQVDVLEQIVEEDNEFKTIPVDTLIKSGSSVTTPSEKMIVEFLGLNANPDKGYNLGRLDIPGSKAMNLLVKRDIIQRHIFIGGTTGSGKSYAAKVLIEEIHKKHIPIIVFDTQYEFVPLTEKLHGKVLVPAQDYTIPLHVLTLDEILNIVPIVNDTHTALLSSAILELKDDQNLRNSFTLEDLINRIETAGEEMHSSKATVPIVEGRVNFAIGHSNYIGSGYDWTNTLKKDAIIDINCRDFERQSLQVILAATLRELQVLRKENKIPPFIIFIDEAHLFVPDDEQTACKQIIRETVRIGRHHGICAALITQSPIDIDKKIIRQCNTRFIFALEADQLMAIQGVKADATEEMLNRLPKAQQGSCILTGTYETVKHAVPIQIRELENTDADAGQTPNIFSDVDQYA